MLKQPLEIGKVKIHTRDYLINVLTKPPVKSIDPVFEVGHH